MALDWGVVIASGVAGVFSIGAGYFKYQLEKLRADQKACNEKHEDLKTEALIGPSKIDMAASITLLEDRFREAETYWQEESAGRRREIRRLEKEIAMLKRREES